MLVQVSFGIRLPNGLAPSSPRPQASVSLSKFCCALFILFVRFGYPNLARGVLAEIRSHYVTMLVNNPIQAQECRSIDTMLMKVICWKTTKSTGRDMHIHDSQNQWISPSVNRQRIHRRSICKSGTAGAYSPSSSRRSRSAKQRDVGEECCGSPFLRL